MKIHLCSDSDSLTYDALINESCDVVASNDHVLGWVAAPNDFFQMERIPYHPGGWMFFYIIDFIDFLKIGVTQQAPSKRYGQHFGVVKNVGGKAPEIGKMFVSVPIRNARDIESIVANRFSGSGTRSEWIRYGFDEVISFLKTLTFNTKISSKEINEINIRDEYFIGLLKGINQPDGQGHDKKYSSTMDVSGIDYFCSKSLFDGDSLNMGLACRLLVIAHDDGVSLPLLESIYHTFLQMEFPDGFELLPPGA